MTSYENKASASAARKIAVDALIRQFRQDIGANSGTPRLCLGAGCMDKTADERTFYCEEPARLRRICDECTALTADCHDSPAYLSGARVR